MNFDQLITDRLNDRITANPSVLMPWLENDVNEIALIAMMLADTGFFKVTAPAGIFEHLNPKFVALMEQIETIRDRAAEQFHAAFEREEIATYRAEQADALIDEEIDRRQAA